jgi:hypothetical protein
LKYLYNGLVHSIDGNLFSVKKVEIVDGYIQSINNMRNPEKIKQVRQEISWEE